MFEGLGVLICTGQFFPAVCKKERAGGSVVINIVDSFHNKGKLYIPNPSSETLGVIQQPSSSNTATDGKANKAQQIDCWTDVEKTDFEEDNVGISSNCATCQMSIHSIKSLHLTEPITFKGKPFMLLAEITPWLSCDISGYKGYKCNI